MAYNNRNSLTILRPQAQGQFHGAKVMVLTGSCSLKRLWTESFCSPCPASRAVFLALFSSWPLPPPPELAGWSLPICSFFALPPSHEDTCDGVWGPQGQPRVTFQSQSVVCPDLQRPLSPFKEPDTRGRRVKLRENKSLIWGLRMTPARAPIPE